MKKLYVFFITYCKRFHPKNPLYEKMKMTKKKNVILESFVIVGSFDCDHTYDMMSMTFSSNSYEAYLPFTMWEVGGMENLEASIKCEKM